MIQIFAVQVQLHWFVHVQVYPYLVVTDSCMAELMRREERVLQLMRMLNHFLAKQKETARRFLCFTVPRVVAVAATTRLVEDNPQSLSLLDIYKQVKSTCCFYNFAFFAGQRLIQKLFSYDNSAVKSRKLSTMRPLPVFMNVLQRCRPGALKLVTKYFETSWRKFRQRWYPATCSRNGPCLHSQLPPIIGASGKWYILLFLL